MSTKSICRNIIALISLVMLYQLAYSDCNHSTIVPFIDDGKELRDELEQHTTRSTRKEICMYAIKYSRGEYYIYTLLNEDGKVVYCGITNDPQRRTREHAEDGKDFSQMIALGQFGKEGAIDKEKMCVCEYTPVLNRLPQCRREGVIYGGGTACSFELDGNMYYLELK